MNEKEMEESGTELVDVAILRILSIDLSNSPPDCFEIAYFPKRNARDGREGRARTGREGESEDVAILRILSTNPHNLISGRTFSPSPTPPHSGENSFHRVYVDLPISSESSASPSSSSSPGSSSTTSSAEEGRHRRRERPQAEYQDEQARVLHSALCHVSRLGWTEDAMMAGARDVEVSLSFVWSFPRKDSALVEYFMDDCFEKLIDRIDSGLEFSNLSPSERISKIIRIRLEMQAPYLSKWPQVLSIQARALNFPTSFKQRAALNDDIWHASGDDRHDIDWYVKRTVLGGIYSTTEIYMLTDSSPEFRDTWAFVDDRVRDAFDLKKTIQEATYLAKAIGAGIGNSFQGFVKKVLQR